MSMQSALIKIQKSISQMAPGRVVRLVAVSKTFNSEAVKAAYDLGLRDFGENKVQELLEKQAQLPADIGWHMIGRLQTNKVKDILGKTVLIHSLDREELFKKIESEARKKAISRVECLVQVNVSGEATKAGFSPDEVTRFLSAIAADSPVKIKGLMTMAPLTDNIDEIRVVFRKTKVLFDQIKREFPGLSMEHLSMGMSGDFEVALQEGATMVRIGTALFGARDAH